VRRVRVRDRGRDRVRVRRVLLERLTLALTLTRCVREARGRAIVESEAAEQAAANADKSAAKAVPANPLEPEP